MVYFELYFYQNQIIKQNTVEIFHYIAKIQFPSQ
jgi:hypothetical protein